MSSDVLPVDTWEFKSHANGFHVDGELVISVPNNGMAPFMNTVGGAIVVMYRGSVSQDAGGVQCKAVRRSPAQNGVVVQCPNTVFSSTAKNSAVS